jgi:hypothetical protein
MRRQNSFSRLSAGIREQLKPELILNTLSISQSESFFLLQSMRTALSRLW